MDRGVPGEGGRSGWPRRKDKEGRRDEQEPSHHNRASHSAAAGATTEKGNLSDRVVSEAGLAREGRGAAQPGGFRSIGTLRISAPRTPSWASSRVRSAWR